MAKKSQPSGKSLVIVESPAKAKTINKYLGPEFVVKASMGHIRDLPSHTLGVDVDNNFEPTYEIVESRKKILNELTKASKNAPFVYLATDLDREGEAIAWHLAEALGTEPERIRRVVFNEITESAIKQAFAQPHSINIDKVNAQQARRTLDRIVGYQLSPLLWRKVAKGLSAGRVQSVAVRVIVEREQEIREFVPVESWRIQAVFTSEPTRRDELGGAWSEFLGGAESENGRTVKERVAWLSERGCLAAELVSVGDETFKVNLHTAAREVAESLGFICDGVEETPRTEYTHLEQKTVVLKGKIAEKSDTVFTVSDLQTRRSSTKAPGPFTTATLQQAASTMLGFSASKTMRTAQTLYEGTDVGDGEGSVGLITYMRTDSTQLSAESVNAIRAHVAGAFGDKYLPTKPNVFGKKGKRTQEAHEAVRPSDVRREPSQLKKHLTSDQWRLYDLIWRRAVACQMKPAQWDSTTLLISAPTPKGEAVFKASGRQLVFDGYQRVAAQRPSTDVILPSLDVGQRVAPLDIVPEQQYSAPPPRYSEASLVKSLESNGIGRPSTYAAIIQTIQDRGYVEQWDRRFYATDKGQVVTQKLVEHFPNIINLKFTSYMEDELDKIEDGTMDWVTVLREFYEPFKKDLARAETEMTVAKAEPSEYKCPKCDKEMVYRWARTGRFLSCSGYPECNGAHNIDRDGKPVLVTGDKVACEKCGKDMILRQSRHGYFLGCSGYPECNTIVSCNANGEPDKLVTDKELERPCEDCGEGTLTVKRAGARLFLGCDRYPKCKSTQPLPEGVRLERKETSVEEAGFGCERCGQPMHIKSGRRGKFIACSGFPKCRNTKPVEKLDELRKLAAEGKLPTFDRSDAADPVQEDQAGEAKKRASGGAKVAARRPIKKGGKVDIEALGPPPAGYAWTRTGRPVVETWPEDVLYCPQCGKEMTLKSGRFGPFYSCSNFPKCKTSINLRGEAKKRADVEMPAPVRPKPIPTDIACEECGEKMLIRSGRSGPFLGCSNYPKCKTTKPLPEELAGIAASASAK